LPAELRDPTLTATVEGDSLTSDFLDEVLNSQKRLREAEHQWGRSSTWSLGIA
jgi:hypothetical protein